jgi:DNA-binding GntR family transcriptional regulator
MSETEAPLFDPIPRDDLAQRVARRLADAVTAGRLKPGERLSESAAAREMGVSRAPVREAARLLESAGLLVSRPNRGFFVRSVSADDLDAVYELRIAIEAEASARLARVGAAHALPRLSAHVERMRALADAGAHVEQVDADLAFHRALCAACGNPRLLAVFDQIVWEMRLGLVLIGRLYDDPHLIAETHAPILAALRAGDPQAAAAAMRYHIGAAREAVVARFRALEGDET